MEVTSHISAKGESSSLRTQLIEAQILDCQLKGDEYGLGNLITSEYSANLDDQNGEAHENTIKDIDDTILRLRRWQLDREISKEELIVNMIEASHLGSSNVDEALESTNREEEAKKYRSDHDMQISRTKTSVATIECLLHPCKPLDGSQQLVDLSRLADQDKLISSEVKWSLQAIEKLEKEIDDSNFRRIVDEARSSSQYEMKLKEKEIITSDLDLETEFTSISDRFQYFSSALDSLLLQSDEVVDVDVDIHNLSDSLSPSSSPSVSVSNKEVEPLFVSEKSVGVITPIVAIALATTTTATTTTTIAAASAIVTSIATGKLMPKKKNDITSSSSNSAMNKSVLLKIGKKGLNRLPSPPTLNQSSPLLWK